MKKGEGLQTDRWTKQPAKSKNLGEAKIATKEDQSLPVAKCMKICVFEEHNDKE